MFYHSLAVFKVDSFFVTFSEVYFETNWFRTSMFIYFNIIRQVFPLCSQHILNFLHVFMPLWKSPIDFEYFLVIFLWLFVVLDTTQKSKIDL